MNMKMNFSMDEIRLKVEEYIKKKVVGQLVVPY